MGERRRKGRGLGQEEGCLVHHSRGNELVQLQGRSSFGDSGEMRVAFIR